MPRKYFGTDGIRGKFGEDPITPEFALKLGFAAGRVFASQAKKGQAKVVMGKDTRLSGYILESALQAGLNAAGVYVHLLGPLPTPAIAHLTRALHASLGIVISASHNPYEDNGIKLFGPDGYKLSDADEIEMEALMARVNGVFHRSPGRIAAPYVVLEDMLATDWSTKDQAGREGRHHGAGFAWVRRDAFEHGFHEVAGARTLQCAGVRQRRTPVNHPHGRRRGMAAGAGADEQQGTAVRVAGYRTRPMGKNFADR